MIVNTLVATLSEMQKFLWPRRRSGRLCAVFDNVNSLRFNERESEPQGYGLIAAISYA